MTQAEKLCLVAVLLVGFSVPTESVGDVLLLTLRVGFAIAFVWLPGPVSNAGGVVDNKGEKYGLPTGME